MNPYEVLGVERDATPEAIKAAYHKKAKIHHPDVNQNSPESLKAFQEIQNAYEMLSNPQTQQHHHYQHNPFGAEFHFENFDAVFSDLFRRAQQRPRANPPKSVVLEVTLEQVLGGCEFDVVMEDLPGRPTYRVQIPVGVQHEQRIRIPEGGPRPDSALPPGDLFIIIAVRQHPRFRRLPGNILTTDLEIDSLEAILGVKTNIHGLDGTTLAVEVPPGTQYADRIMIPGQGLRSGPDDNRAALYVNIGVKTPTNLTEKHIDLVQRLTEMLPISSRLE